MDAQESLRGTLDKYMVGSFKVILRVTRKVRLPIKYQFARLCSTQFSDGSDLWLNAMRPSTEISEEERMMMIVHKGGAQSLIQTVPECLARQIRTRKTDNRVRAYNRPAICSSYATHHR